MILQVFKGPWFVVQPSFEPASPHCNIREGLKVMISEVKGSDDNVTIIFPTIHLACCLLLAVNYRKAHECFHIYKKHEKEFLNYYPMRCIILYEHPCHLSSTNCGKHDLPNNLRLLGLGKGLKGLEIRAG